MMRFTNLPYAEIERRRKVSIEALAEMSKTAFEKRYQERCDSYYWRQGRCCAGCDHWASAAGDVGECSAAPPVSGMDVLKSLGIDWSSHVPPPGQPFTNHSHVCGAFKDDFDWSTLSDDYLFKIGAAKAIESRTDGSAPSKDTGTRPAPVGEKSRATEIDHAH